ncbi:MAG: glycosyltransferase family 9 protein [Elusimicrobia bacterium]|nr:glycosyltransferase family 9 protein [Elusimicrobiota bacterium]
MTPESAPSPKPGAWAQSDPGSKPGAWASPKRILVIQLRRIGDVLMATPALKALKKRYPAAAIDFLVEPPCDEVLSGNPDVAAVLVYRSDGWRDYLSWLARIRGRRYDWVVDFMGNPRSAILAAASGAPLRAGPAHVGHRWAYNLRMVQSSTIRYAGREKIRLLSGLGVPDTDPAVLPTLHLGTPKAPDPAGPIVFAPASRKPTRRWPGRHYAALGRMLRERFRCPIIVLWGPGEKGVADEVAEGIGEGATAPETKTLREAATILAGCRLLATNCGGAKHLAVALGVPTLTIHGSSDPASWTPPDPRHLALRREGLPCIGCGLNDCPRGIECLEGLSPEKVFAAACRLLDAMYGPS